MDHGRSDGGLTYFAFVEALRNARQDRDRESGLRHRLEAVSRLARRSCDATVRENEYYADARSWGLAVGSSARFDPLQAQFLEIRTLAAELGGSASVAAGEAFEGFLAAADRVNLLADTKATMSLSDAAARRTEALGFFPVAGDALAVIASRLPDERPVPPGNVATVG